MSKFEESFKELINIMSDGFTKEILERNSEEALKIKDIYDSDKERFFDKVESVQFQFNTIIEEIIGIPNQKNKYILEHIISGLYGHFLEHYIKKFEGIGCSVDKKRYIESMTIRALKENKNLSLYDDYTNYEQIEEDKKCQAYWSPTTLKDTDVAMEMFWNWYLLRS